MRKKLVLTLSALTILTAAFASMAQAGPKGGGQGGKSFAAKPAQKFAPKMLPNTSSPPFQMANHAKMNTPQSNHVKVSNYHLTKGIPFSQGYFYRGRNHTHWLTQRWDARYGCTCYWDPCALNWYYWCQPDLCYYPVSYCPYQVYCWAEPVPPVVSTCLPCTQGVVGTAGIAGPTGEPDLGNGIPVEPIDGTLASPMLRPSGPATGQPTGPSITYPTEPSAIQSTPPMQPADGPPIPPPVIVNPKQ